MKEVIVIGSGISGMTCACALANKGYKVTVLEKHSVAGGYCQSFSRKGFRFAAAVHRIGGIHGKNSVEGILSALGVKNLPEWYAFHERVHVGDIDFRMCNISAADALRELFPDEKVAIDHFEAEVNRINSLLDIIDNGVNAGIGKFSLSNLKMLDKYRRMSVDKFLRGIFSNEKIVSLLVAVSDALPGGALFAFIRMVSFANCGEETYQPVGGAGAVIEILCERLIELGGSVLLNSPAERIIMENGRAVGVVCKGEIRKPSHRDDIIMGRYAAKKAVADLAGTNIYDVSISKGIFNQPVVLVDSRGSLQVTVTHMGGIAAAVAFSEQFIVGIDIEKELSFARKEGIFLSEEEKHSVESIGIDKTIFWTVREALIKCLKLSAFCSPKILELTEICRECNLVTGTFRYFGQYSFQAVSHKGIVIGMVIPKMTDMIPDLDKVAENVAVID